MLSLDRRYALPVFLAWMLLIAFFVVSELRRSDVRDAAAQIWVATDRVRLLTDIRSLITDAETGQRGYLLTGDEAYLQPFERAKAELPTALDDVRASYRTGNDAALAKTDRLADLTRVKLGELQATIDLYRERGSTNALKIVHTGVGEETMDELRSVIDDMRVSERSRVASANELWNREHFISSVTMAAGTVLNMLLVLLAGHLVTRDMRRRKDVTERLESEISVRTQELAELSSHLQRVSESEKGALARELHDELGAVLVAVKMDLSQLRRHLPKGDPEVDKRWERIQSSLSEGIDLKRRVVEQLRPTLLDNMGLSAALKWQLQETCARSGLAYRERFPDDEPGITSEAAIAIFRIVQESLTNIVKHASAKSVDLWLDIESEHLIVTILDDGVGFAPGRRPLSGAHGLRSMRHRVRSMGGEIVIEARDREGGTRVWIKLPLAGITPRLTASA
jgi:signal transduction histidine kinase